MAKSYGDCGPDDEIRHAKNKARRLKKTIPEGWAQCVDALTPDSAGLNNWRVRADWIEALDKFRTDHGASLKWAMGDFEICQKGKKMAGAVAGLLKDLQGADGALTIEEQLDIVVNLCDAVGVGRPKSLTAQGAVNRGLCHIWWRRVLRRKVARTVEHGAISLGLVNKTSGGYASDDAVARRAGQLARNEKMLAATLMRNEAGQIFTLAELASFSVSNRDNRRGELMTRIRGCEEFAGSEGHEGLFFTLTCPSKFHSMTAPHKNGRALKNRKYQGASPREAQAWMCKTWARARAELARKNIQMYGFRVAEPHHDGCPHWHALLWFAGGGDAGRATGIIKDYWLEEDGNEPGARRNRVNVKKMMAGGAAGYIAKYIAKNVGGNIDIGRHLDGTGGDLGAVFGVDVGAVQGYQRVDAWAATWGIRQFQAIGQPPVTVWRELRRVTRDQIDTARVDGDKAAWWLWGAVHRDGDEQADWCGFMRHMGGVCRRRGEWAARVASRETPRVNDYAERVVSKKTVGLELLSGRWLISRRQKWTRAADGAGVQDVGVRAAKSAPWTGFNNCTARLGGEARRTFLGRRAHDLAGGSGVWDGG